MDMEKIYLTMKRTGAGNIVLGILSICIGLASGIIMTEPCGKSCRAILRGFSCARYVSKATKEIASSPAGPSAYAEPPAFQQGCV